MENVQVIKNPQNFLCGEGVLNDISYYSKKIGTNAYIVGTKKSYAAVKNKIISALKKENMKYSTRLFENYPTIEQAVKYSEDIKKEKADLVIAIGGGRVIDVMKYAATLANIKIITVPTIAATSAAWRCNSILYLENGSYDRSVVNQFSPEYVIADSSIIVQAPIRYIYAGIMDAVAKWYESRPYREMYTNDLNLLFSLNVAKQAFEFLESNTPNITTDFKQGKSSNLVIQTIINVIALTGIAGCYSSELKFPGFAHPFYNEVTKIQSTKNLLHGEIIGFGILTQIMLEQNSSKEFKDALNFFEKFNFNYTLEDMGITEVYQLEHLANNLWKNKDKIRFLQHIKTSKEIQKAILKVNDIVIHKKAKKEANL
ncbi:iron-containing alcohol dehydrogenase [Rummeliibacillus sp. SL167]|uniref:iron-containing alcohol dehydrogenase n=1 Tax=Rummeliibacillus sp. SL167 TaxID=2579792 RepID=UPI0016487F36|nr:iron-containing alcohol dehydrogenase [Rummeliibacillus sp. SL167]